MEPMGRIYGNTVLYFSVFSFTNTEISTDSRYSPALT